MSLVCGGWWCGDGHVVGQGGQVPGWGGATQGDVWCNGGAGTQGPLLAAIAWGEGVAGEQGLWVTVTFRTQWGAEVPQAQGPEPRLLCRTRCALWDVLERLSWSLRFASFVGCV